MRNFFSIDSPFVVALTRFADVMWLNILTLIFAIPLFIEQALILGPVISPIMTEGGQFNYDLFVAAVMWAWIFGIPCSAILGPACTAMHYVLLKMVRDEDSYITKSFFKSFKENFKQGIVLQIIKFIVGGMLIVDFFILSRKGGFYRYVVFAMFIVLYIVGLYVFPLLSKFVNTNMKTIKNAFMVAIIALPRSFGMAIISILPLICAYFFDIKVVPVYVLIGIAGPSYLCAKLYDPTFKRFEPEEEQLSEEEELSAAIRKIDSLDDEKEE
ncbi:MAG: YesL family protein [Butyrivibrio sp.]|nr:YesL family protein [Butyrivibrio sp.]